MANTKANASVVEEPTLDPHRMVPYRAPIDMRNLSGVRYVSINGENYRIMNGETVMLPHYVVKELLRQDKEEVAIQRRIQHAVEHPPIADSN